MLVDRDWDLYYNKKPETETQYAVIELEMLAVCWAIMKCRVFLADLQHFNVATDHNPLIPILNTRRLNVAMDHNPLIPILNTRRLDEVENLLNGIQFYRTVDHR